jgi:hypothetical protein
MQMHHPQLLPIISAIVALVVVNFLASVYTYWRLLKRLDDEGVRDVGMIFGVMAAMALGVFGGDYFAAKLGFWPGLAIGGSAWALLAALVWLVAKVGRAIVALVKLLMGVESPEASTTTSGAAEADDSDDRARTILFPVSRSLTAGSPPRRTPPRKRKRIRTR